MKHGEANEVERRVSLTAVPMDDIVAFIKTLGRKDKLFVTDVTGENRFQLCLNHMGELCFLVGNNKRLVGEMGRDLYLASDDLDKVRHAREVNRLDHRLTLDDQPGEGSGITGELIAGINAFIDYVVGSGRPTVVLPKADPVPVVEEKAAPEIVRKVSKDRLKNVLSLVRGANGRYVISYDFGKGCHKITSNDRDGKSASIFQRLKSMCREVRLRKGKLEIYLNISHDEEKEAKMAGYKVTVTY